MVATPERPERAFEYFNRSQGNTLGNTKGLIVPDCKGYCPKGIGGPCGLLLCKTWDRAGAMAEVELAFTSRVGRAAERIYVVIPSIEEQTEVKVLLA